MLNFKAEIDFVLVSSLFPSRESIPRGNLFSQGIDSVKSMPGVLKNLKIRLRLKLPQVPFRGDFLVHKLVLYI
jgi:hypothetical protein